MSWSISKKTYKNAAVAREGIAKEYAPDEVKAMIDRGLSHFRNADKPVTIETSYGHVCDSPNSFEEVSGTLKVRYANEEEIAATTFPE